jgi:sec-independent protein translocase protein TatA
VGIENPVHLLFIAIVALIVLGPKRLPALARAVGQGIREFRAALSEGANADEEVDHRPAVTAAAMAEADSLHTPDQGAAADER